ncbi:MAG: cob(I)yrinic acid a,c-diamide adenosyltransferase [Balneolaceae bacterium]|nr:cob(I)yrinic acid a,c-diamide adenosyltransferase [Balneolaceae bacterium]
MKIYTRKGDTGKTSLYGGERVSKASLRIDAYGNVDELNSVIGLAVSFGLSEKGGEWIRKIQEFLMILGADLATPPSASERIDRISSVEVDYLEQAIDEMDEELPPLKNFLLPGGSHTGATLHQARTICRRAERAAVHCSEQEEISDHVITFLNRLSDFLFVLARYENKESGASEEKWNPKRNR